MINIQKLLRQSIEKQKLRPISEVRQLIYEKLRRAIKSKLIETNAPDFIKRTYILRLEAAICEVEAFYFLKPEYFVLKDNKIPFHFAYQAYLPDYFCTRQDMVVDPASLRWLTTGQRAFAHMSFQDDDLPLTDAELFEFRTPNTPNNRANVFNDKSRIIDLADRKVARQNHAPLSRRVEVRNSPPRESNVYPAVNNQGKAYLEGQRGAVNAFLRSMPGGQPVPDEQSINVGEAFIYGQAAARQVQPRHQEVGENRQTYYVPQPPVNEQKINANTPNNNQFSDRVRKTENDRRPSSPAGEQLRAETRQNGGVNASQQGNSRQISQEQMAAAQRAYSGAPRGQGYDNATRTPFSQPRQISQEQMAAAQRAYSGAPKGQGYDNATRTPFSQPRQISQEQMAAAQRAYSGAPKGQGYDNAARALFSQPIEPINSLFNNNIDDYSSLPNIFFIDRTSVSSNLTAANIPQPNSTSQEIPFNEQKRESEQQFFKRETVVMATPSPSPQIAETVRPVPNDVSNQERDMRNRIAAENGIRPASSSQDNVAYPNGEGANFNPAVSRDPQNEKFIDGQPSGSTFAKVANNGDKFITEPLVQKPARALNTQADLASENALQTSENSFSKIPEPHSFSNTGSGTVAAKNALDDDGIKAPETAENKEVKVKTAQDNGNLFTFNDIEIEEITQEDETKQKFSYADDGVVDDEAPIPDFIVKYDKETDDLFDRLESSQSPSRSENQPQSAQASRVPQGHQLQSNPLEQDLLPKILSFNKRKEKKPALYKFLLLSLHENLRGKGSIAAGILLACVASSGAYYFLRGYTPVSTTTINNEGPKQNTDLSQTAAINPNGSLKQNPNGATGSNSKEPAKTPRYDMSSQPLDQTRKDVSLPPVVIYPSGGQSPYQEAMIEPPKNDGLSGLNPQDAKIQTKSRSPASMLLKDKKGMQKKLAGSVLWSLVPPHSSDNSHDETALIGDFTTEDGLLDVRMTIRKNYREDLDVTHLIDLSFSQFDGFEAGPVVDVRGIYFGDKANILNKQAPATVANLFENNFVASLRRTPDDQEYNKYFIGRAAVFGFPATFSDGKTALFVLNKGSQDQEIFDKFNDNSTH